MLDRLWLISLLLVHAVSTATAGLAGGAACSPAGSPGTSNGSSNGPGCTACVCAADCGCSAEEQPVDREVPDAAPARSVEVLGRAGVGFEVPRSALASEAEFAVATREHAVPLLSRLAFLCVWRT